jgi:diacylglycerol kinase family enzyme
VKATILINRGGGSVGETRAIRDALDASGIEGDVEVVDGADLHQAAEKAVAEGVGLIVAGGGDGTISCVAGAVAGTRTKLGVLPLGTLNHFAKDVGIPVDLEQAVAAIVAGRQRSVDAGAVNDRIFVNNSSIGIYPDIVAAREDLRHQGHRKWAAFALATARILRQYRGVRVRLEAGALARTAVTPFLFVGNNEYQVEGIRLGSRLKLDAGRLYAYLAPRLRGPDLPKLLALALTGRAMETHALESFATRDLEVETPAMRAVRVALDGEVTFMSVPLRYRILPRALSVIVPAS